MAANQKNVMYVFSNGQSYSMIPFLDFTKQLDTLTRGCLQTDPPCLEKNYFIIIECIIYFENFVKS